MTEKVSPSVFTITACLLGLSTLTNFMLVAEVHRLRESISIESRKTTLFEGDQVPGETLADVQGGTWKLTYSSATSPTILYVMSPVCGWCLRNSEAVSSLAKDVEGRYRFLAVSLTSSVPDLKNYMETQRVQYPIYLAPGTFATDYKAYGTPTTVVVGTNGKVLKVWQGAYFGGIATEMENYFHIQLPRVADGNAH